MYRWNMERNCYFSTKAHLPTQVTQMDVKSAKTLCSQHRELSQYSTKHSCTNYNHWKWINWPHCHPWMLGLARIIAYDSIIAAVYVFEMQAIILQNHMIWVKCFGIFPIVVIRWLYKCNFICFVLSGKVMEYIIKCDGKSCNTSAELWYY